MNRFKIFAAVISVAAVFGLAACQNGSESEPDYENPTSEAAESVAADVTDNDKVVPDTTDVTDSVSEEFVTAENEEFSTHEETTAADSDNPADWSVEKIVEVYKSAAKKSHASAVSTRSISLKSISVNNGEYEGLFEFITPIMSKLLANNSTEVDGITGGYNNLAPSDLVSAKAYKSGSNTVVEMVMKEQVSGAKDDALAGSVGHAITAVGDISVVTQQLKDLGLPLDISEKDTKIYYTNPTVKVLINSNGEIVNGTWRYTVDINMNNYKAFGKDVKTTSVVMDNTITLNGGFRK